MPRLLDLGMLLAVFATNRYSCGAGIGRSGRRISTALKVNSCRAHVEIWQYLFLVNISGVLLGFELFLVRPSGREYMWFGVAHVFWSLMSVCVRDEERLAGEAQPARAVQHVLIPDELPSVPGYHIDGVYKPASEVGGDFCQVVPLDGGGALIAIGDVSGKGMPAAHP